MALSLSGLFILTVHMPSEVDVVTRDMVFSQFVPDLNVIYFCEIFPHLERADADATQVRRSL